MLLCVGHVDTAADDSIERWQEHAASKSATFFCAQPYPVEPLVHAPEIISASLVALRGMGLSMLDVVGALSQGRGGRFIGESAGKCQYKPSGREPKRLVPFSLDGQALAPKPVNARQDARYRPSETQVKQLTSLLEAAISAGDEALPNILETGVTEVTEQLFRRGESPPKFGANVDDTLPAEAQMRRFLSMAMGDERPSRDYCIGQVWRHFQTLIFDRLSHTDLSADVIKQVMSLHQRMKRYAFGPPVCSVRQALALVDAGLLCFEVCDDPAITPTDNGWLFSESGDQLVADKLIAQLRHDEHLSARAPGLGVRTTRDARVLRESDQQPVVPDLTLLGRLATGSFIEADSLTEAFDESVTLWADALLHRLGRPGG